LTTQSGSARSAQHPSFTERIAARLDCVVKDLELSPLFGPLWQYAPASAVAATGSPDALARVLVRRAERILEHTPPGLEYYGGILADATLRTALFAEATPHCTLADVYRARKEPEATVEADVFSVENTEKYVDEFVSAVSVLPGKTKSASARFLAKGILDNLSSVRYVSTQLFKILASGEEPERNLVETLVAMSVLGAMPHCRVVAPVEVRLWLYRDPSAAVAQLTKRVKSKALWLMLVEFVSATVERWPILDRTLARATENDPECDTRFKMINNDAKLRRDVIGTIQFHILKTAPEGAKPPKTGRYNISSSGLRCVPVVSPYEEAISNLGIKRKLSGKIVTEIGPQFSGIYRGVVESAPRARQIDLAAMARLGVPRTAAGRTLYLHAIEQRAAGLVIVPTLPVVETCQRRAATRARVELRVDVCARCNSLRETPAGEKQNKATGGSLLSLHDGRKECANCGSCAVVSIDPAGYWFLWLARHIDREQKVATVCAFCGVFSKPAALRGNMPICGACISAKDPKSTRTTACALCSAKIHRKASFVSVLCKNPRAFDGTPKIAAVCHPCGDLDALDRVWDVQTMKRKLQPKGRR